jgi:hypothetical protein
MLLDPAPLPSSADEPAHEGAGKVDDSQPDQPGLEDSRPATGTETLDELLRDLEAPSPEAN